MLAPPLRMGLGSPTAIGPGSTAVNVLVEMRTPSETNEKIRTVPARRRLLPLCYS
jgi:hypothetical protein